MRSDVALEPVPISVRALTAFAARTEPLVPTILPLESTVPTLRPFEPVTVLLGLML